MEICDSSRDDKLANSSKLDPKLLRPGPLLDRMVRHLSNADFLRLFEAIRAAEARGKPQEVREEVCIDHVGIQVSLAHGQAILTIMLDTPTVEVASSKHFGIRLAMTSPRTGQVVTLQFRGNEISECFRNSYRIDYPGCSFQITFP